MILLIKTKKLKRLQTIRIFIDFVSININGIRNVNSKELSDADAY